MLARVAAMTVTDNMYRLSGLDGLIIGQKITPNADGGLRDPSPLTEAWGLRSGVYTPHQLVKSFAPLLDVIVSRLGQDPTSSKPARARLLDNVAANLATDTREGTLRLTEPLDVSRKEINVQATRIGKTLVQWARESSTTAFDPNMYLRSPCEGHLLIPSNVDLMFGDRSQPHLMQLFNEYMHQMVLLRDALLPFQNYQDVLIPVDGTAARGIRHLEPARTQFLAELFTKHVTQRGIVTYAKALLAPGLRHTTSAGYGFQYAHGTILPAFLSGGPTPLHLLQYFPTKVDSTVTDILFANRFEDYYSAPRNEIPAGIQRHAPEHLDPKDKPQTLSVGGAVGLVPDSAAGNVRQLELRLELPNGKCVAVDLGQIARGHRYSYFAQDPSLHEDGTVQGVSKHTQPIFHDPTTLLETPDTGLLTAKAGGVHVISVQNPVVALAILGKLYPENVVLLPVDEGLSQTGKAGKGFEPKFVIWGGVERGGLKGAL
ncbi:hypothetical protein NUU61_008397 [Penicillium alfredii]|uniref:Uncharacterized protein n=1 Tax=Penicillium alfredii TaxID=1506179 RepID=A0A9W9JZD0_9EURO|nr:uncharacterized protein NUU61_008397 [Penicillium alfredii]KAJ5087090.1 hypothetical protein NUU61_008397 [Penicillium alfredii]